MKVRVYRNLHNGLWSVKCMERDHRHYGKVILHCEEIMLAHVKPVVSSAGRNRVLRERRKNVHAYLEGEIVSYCGEAYKERVLSDHTMLTFSEIEEIIDRHGLNNMGGFDWSIGYNPYRAGYFTCVPYSTKPVEADAFEYSPLVWITTGTSPELSILGVRGGSTPVGSVA